MIVKSSDIYCGKYQYPILPEISSRVARSTEESEEAGTFTLVSWFSDLFIKLAGAKCYHATKNRIKIINKNFEGSFIWKYSKF